MRAFITSDIYNASANVDHVGFHFDTDDLAKWQNAADKCKEIGVSAMYFTDSRCLFFDEDGYHTSFRADACNVAVYGSQDGREFIRFSGYGTLTEREWYTDEIYLSDLASAISQASKETD